MRVIAFLALSLVCRALHIPPSRRRPELESAVGPPVAIRVLNDQPLADVHPRFIHEDLSEEELEERGWSGSWLSTSWDDVDEEDLPWCDDSASTSSVASSMTATSSASVAHLSGGGVLAVQGGQTSAASGSAGGSGGGIIEVVVVTSTVVVAPAATVSDVSGEVETPASKTTSSQPVQTSVDAETQEWLDATNAARAQHGAGNLTWSPDLVARAKANAENCDAGKHTNSGENMASQSGQLTPAQAVQMWMSEAADYNPNNPGFSEQTGHYTQVVWKASVNVGCYIAECAAGSMFPAKYGTSYKGTCEYDPPGNVVGDNNYYFIINVG